MSELIIIIGDSGTGKSTSLRNLDPKETIIINVGGKRLPFRGATKKFENKIFHTAQSAKIVQWLEKMKENKEVRNIIIDDFQFIGGFEYLARANEKGYEKFSQIAQNMFLPLYKSVSLRDDQKVFVLAHQEVDDQKNKKIKTVGKMVDQAINFESLATIVLYTEIKDGNYYFRTQNTGFNTGKSPMGMFEEELIENDLQKVIEKIDNYYKGE